MQVQGLEGELAGESARMKHHQARETHLADKLRASKEMAAQFEEMAKDAISSLEKDVGATRDLEAKLAGACAESAGLRARVHALEEGIAAGEEHACELEKSLASRETCIENLGEELVGVRAHAADLEGQLATTARDLAANLGESQARVESAETAARELQDLRESLAARATRCQVSLTLSLALSD